MKSKEEIEDGKCIMVTADENVEMNRFREKRLIKTKVEGVKDSVLNFIMN